MNYIKGSTPQFFSDSHLPQEIEAHEHSLPQAQDQVPGRRSSNNRQCPRQFQTLVTTLPACQSIASDPTRMAGNERGLLLQTTSVEETIFPEHAEMRSKIKVTQSLVPPTPPLTTESSQALRAPADNGINMFPQLRGPPHRKVPQAVSVYSRLPAGQGGPSTDDYLDASIPGDSRYGWQVCPTRSSRP